MTGNKGSPDIIAVRGNRLLFAELKSDEGKLSLEQEEWLAALKACHIFVGLDERNNALYLPEVYLWKPEDIDEIQKILE